MKKSKKLGFYARIELLESHSNRFANRCNLLDRLLLAAARHAAYLDKEVNYWKDQFHSLKKSYGPGLVDLQTEVTDLKSELNFRAKESIALNERLVAQAKRIERLVNDNQPPVDNRQERHLSDKA